MNEVTQTLVESYTRDERRDRRAEPRCVCGHGLIAHLREGFCQEVDMAAACPCRCQSYSQQPDRRGLGGSET